MNFREKLEQSRMQVVGGTSTVEAAEPVTCTYYAADRDSPVCIDLRLADGSRKAIPYSYFTEINFETEAGIEILTASKRILITGRNLLALYENLTRYRVRYVQTDIGTDTQEDGLFVENISYDALS